MRSGQRQKRADDLLLVRRFDAREQLLAELADGLGTVERQPRVHLPALEMTGLAAALEDGPDVFRELDLRRDGRWLRRRRRGGHQAPDQPEDEGQHAIKVARRARKVM